MVSIFLFLSQNSTEKWSYTFLQLSKATEDFHLEIKEAEFHCGIFQFCFLGCYCLSKGVSYIVTWMILAQLCARIYYSDERDSYWDWVPELWPVCLSTPWMLLRDILHVVGKEQRHPLVCRLRMEEMFSESCLLLLLWEGKMIRHSCRNRQLLHKCSYWLCWQGSQLKLRKKRGRLLRCNSIVGARQLQR